MTMGRPFVATSIAAGLAACGVAASVAVTVLAACEIPIDIGTRIEPSGPPDGGGSFLDALSPDGAMDNGSEDGAVAPADAGSEAIPVLEIPGSVETKYDPGGLEDPIDVTLPFGGRLDIEPVNDEDCFRFEVEGPSLEAAATGLDCLAPERLLLRLFGPEPLPPPSLLRSAEGMCSASMVVETRRGDHVLCVSVHGGGLGMLFDVEIDLQED